MAFGIENLGILFGLVALAAPIILHFLQRRRYDVLDWGAMQFLPDSHAMQRRRWLDEILLLLMRMGLIALIVVALATPIANSAWLAALGEGRTREIVLVLDGSYSMDARVSGQPTPWEQGIRRAQAIVDESDAGDRFAILIARKPAHFEISDFTADRDELRDKLSTLPIPRGNPDMPGALAEAWKHLQSRKDARAKQIVVLTDGQRHGWTDPATLSALEHVASQWQTDIQSARSDGFTAPTVRVEKIAGPLPAMPSNCALGPIQTRSVARVGQKVSFRGTLHLDHFPKFTPPRSVKALVDGKVVQTLPLPDNADLKTAQAPLTFDHTFSKPGDYVVTFALDAEKDALAADNEQHVAVEAVKDLQVMLIDGDKETSVESSTYFLQHALDPNETRSAQAIAQPKWKPSDTFKPAVLVLADVPTLDSAQLAAIDRYVADGGGLLVALGERTARAQLLYNAQPWMPAKLADVAASKDGMAPQPRSFQHPALELFRAETSMKQVRFAQWHRVQPGQHAVIASLVNGDAMLIERPYKKGRVILATVPMDRRWGSTLPNAAEYPILMHELSLYLAGARQSAETGEGIIGVHRVGNRPVVVRPEREEANLERASEDDWNRVRDRLRAVWHDDVTVSVDEGGREEIWWLFFLAVLALLSAEVWMTRRMALARGG